MHQVHRRLLKTQRRVIDSGSADLEQLALAHQAQIGGLFADHVMTFIGANLFSPRDKKSFSTES